MALLPRTLTEIIIVGVDMCLCFNCGCICYWNKLIFLNYETIKGRGQEDNRRHELIKCHINADGVHYANWYYANTWVWS